MSEEIFEIYEFIKDSDFEVHCYDYEGMDKQIVVFISPLWSKEFLELLSNQVPSSLEEGGYNISIVNNGYLCIDIVDIINHYCHEDEFDKWFNRFKKYSS